MKSTPFDPEKDFAPIPLDKNMRQLAQELKSHGLVWQPQVGSFVWDPENTIPVPSPFPDRIYFVLNLNHFLKILGSIERMQEKLVWLPSWQQARQICLTLDIPHSQIQEKLRDNSIWSAQQETRVLYELILEKLKAVRV